MTTPSALTIIRAEHQALAAILHALRHTLCHNRDHGARPNFEALFSRIVNLLPAPLGLGSAA